jgi:hypothetical protein
MGWGNAVQLDSTAQCRSGQSTSVVVVALNLTFFPHDRHAFDYCESHSHATNCEYTSYMVRIMAFVYESKLQMAIFQSL